MTPETSETSSVRGIQSVLVLADFDKPPARRLAGELDGWLRTRVRSVELRPDLRAFAEERGAGGAALRPDLLVVLGGDGAILAAVRAFGEEPIPTLGINLGHVGFLAATPAESWREALESCLSGDAVVESRMRLQAEWRRDGKVHRATALNEFTLQRSSHQGMIQAALWSGSDWVTNYRADGVIVATPSGSTAYSLSAGGPILETSLEAVVVTPICPQGLSNRPLVLPSRVELALRVVASSGHPTLAVDGQEYYRLSEGEAVHVRRHPVPVPLLWMHGMDPFSRLRERLGWRGSLEAAERPPRTAGEGGR